MSCCRTFTLEPWQRNQYLIALVVFVTLVGFTFVVPFLPLYVQQLGVRDVGEAALWSGVLLGVAPLLAALAAPFWGSLADRYGIRIMLLRVLATFVLVLVLMGFAQNVFHLLLLRMALGLLGGFNPMSTALMANTVPRDRLGQALGILQSSRLMSAAVGPAIGGVLADLFGLRLSFYVAAGMCIISFVLMWRWYDEAPSAMAVKAISLSSRGPSFSKLVRIPAVAAMLAVLFLVQSIDSSFQPVLPLYISLLGVREQTVASVAGLITSLAAVASAISAAVVGRLSRYRPRQVLIGTLVAGAITCWPMALVYTSTQLLVFRVLLGLVAGGTLTVALTMGGQALPREVQGTGFGLLSAATLLGGAVSPLAAGALTMINLRAVFVVNSLIYVILTLWVLLVVQAEPKQTVISHQPTTPAAPAPKSQTPPHS